ncbi:MAG: zinc ribbon domain-containing protein [Clostridia bacterium]|nr:zinc ribbon domain-containing protein [Clostridia bacterium]
MPYCPNCGKPVPDSANFCPNCGAKRGLAAVQDIVASIAEKTAAETAANPYSVILQDIGASNKAITRELLRGILGYSVQMTQDLTNVLPAAVARNLTRKQAIYLSEAFCEYGVHVAIYGNGKYHSMVDSDEIDVFDDDGYIYQAAAAVLETLSSANRVERAVQWNYAGSFNILDFLFQPRMQRQTPPRTAPRTIPRPAPAPGPAGRDPGPAPRQQGLTRGPLGGSGRMPGSDGPGGKDPRHRI